MSEVPPAPILHSGMKRWELNQTISASDPAVAQGKHLSHMEIEL